MSWPILALLCALCQALADVLTRKFLPRYTAAEVVLVRLGLTAILLLPLVVVQPPGLPEPAFWAGSSWPCHWNCSPWFSI